MICQCNHNNLDILLESDVTEKTGQTSFQRKRKRDIVGVNLS